jgi:hypothetical protein
MNTVPEAVGIMAKFPSTHNPSLEYLKIFQGSDEAKWSTTLKLDFDYSTVPRLQENTSL